MHPPPPSQSGEHGQVARFNHTSRPGLGQHSTAHPPTGSGPPSGPFSHIAQGSTGVHYASNFSPGPGAVNAAVNGSVPAPGSAASHSNTNQYPSSRSPTSPEEPRRAQIMQVIGQFYPQTNNQPSNSSGITAIRSSEQTHSRPSSASSSYLSALSPISSDAQLQQPSQPMQYNHPPSLLGPGARPPSQPQSSPASLIHSSAISSQSYPPSHPKPLAQSSSSPTIYTNIQARPPSSHTVPSQQHPSSGALQLRHPSTGHSPTQPALAAPGSQAQAQTMNLASSAAPSATSGPSMANIDTTRLQRLVAPFLSDAYQTLEKDFSVFGMKFLMQEKESQEQQAVLLSRIEELKLKHESALSDAQQMRDRLYQLQSHANQEVAKARQKVEVLSNAQSMVKQQADQAIATRQEIIRGLTEQLELTNKNLVDMTKQKEVVDSELVRMKATRAFEKGSSLNPIHIKEEPPSSPFPAAPSEQPQLSPRSTPSFSLPHPGLSSSRATSRATSLKGEVLHHSVIPVPESDDPQFTIADLQARLAHTTEELEKAKESDGLINLLSKKADRSKKTIEDLQKQLATDRAEAQQELERVREQAKQDLEAALNRMAAKSHAEAPATSGPAKASDDQTTSSDSTLEDGEVDAADVQNIGQLSQSLRETQTKLQDVIEDRDRLSERVLLVEKEAQVYKDSAAAARKESARYKELIVAIKKKAAEAAEKKAAAANAQSVVSLNDATNSNSSRPSPALPPVATSGSTTPVNVPPKATISSPAVDSSTPMKFLNVAPKPVSLRPANKSNLPFPFRKTAERPPDSGDGSSGSSTPSDVQRTENMAAQPMRKRDSSSFSDAPIDPSFKKPRLEGGST